MIKIITKNQLTSLVLKCEVTTKTIEEIFFKTKKAFDDFLFELNNDLYLIIFNYNLKKVVIYNKYTKDEYILELICKDR